MQVIQGDAFDLNRTLGARHTEPFAGIISGLPLLNFPMAMRRALIDGALTRLAPGAPLVQFSYGMHAPVVPPSGFSVARAAFVWANIPPRPSLGLPQDLRIYAAFYAAAWGCSIKCSMAAIAAVFVAR